MEASVQALYSQAVQEEAAARYGTRARDLQPLGDFENYVYAFEGAAGEGRILRVTHSSHRGPRAVRGELDWIEHLAGAGVGVARGLRSLDGLLVEPVSARDGSTFSVACFERAEGQPAGQVTWGPLLYRAWGRLLGEMHAATRGYGPGDAEHTDRLRHRWDENPYLGIAEGVLPDSERAARRGLDSVRTALAGLPTDREHFGLIHEDLHTSNFHVGSDGRLTAYDFDDCCYHWLPDDLAVALYYALWHPTAREDAASFAEGFLGHLIAGYREASPFDPVWLEWFPHFLRLRDLLLYVVCHAKWDMDALSEGQARLMTSLRERIEAGVPAVDIDYGRLAGALDRDPDAMEDGSTG